VKTLQELKAEQAEAMRKLEAEHAIARHLPLAPSSVMLVHTGEKAWVTYKVADLWEALEVMAKFDLIAMYKFKGTYTRVEPEAINDKRTKDKGESDDVPFAAKIATHGGEGYGPTASLEFFAYVGRDICKIKCDLHKQYGGYYSWHQYGARFQEDSYGRSRRSDGNRIRRGTFRANEKLSGMTDSGMSYANGSDGSWNYTYMLVADYANADYSVEWSDARLRLENIAAAFHGDKADCIRSESYVERVGCSGRLLIMADGSQWFHPHDGGAPVCEVTSKESN
jgi:hypothetical protein